MEPRGRMAAEQAGDGLAAAPRADGYAAAEMNQPAVPDVDTIASLNSMGARQTDWIAREKLLKHV